MFDYINPRAATNSPGPPIPSHPCPASLSMVESGKHSNVFDDKKTCISMVDSKPKRL